MTGKDKNAVPREIDEAALDAAIGAGDGEGAATETVIFQFGAIPVRDGTRTGGDPDKPVVLGRTY